MPEYPDVELYVETLAARVVGQPLEGVELKDPFVLRSVEPPPASAVGKKVVGVRRLGKRVVVELEGQLFIVIHLMIAGRLRWRDPGSKVAPGTLVRLVFPHGILNLTEAGSKRRAKLYFEAGEEALASHDPGGLEVFEADLAQFTARLTLRNHTLKRALTDPTLFSGIGNAYSDEILHKARLSPVKLTQKMASEEIERLFTCTKEVLTWWLEHFRKEVGSGFPEKVTAFRPEMATHGKFGEPCPDCGHPIQRIRYADNETNYCATCQTGGKLLADRSLSRLLKQDWPRSLDELEEHKRARTGGTS